MRLNFSREHLPDYTLMTLVFMILVFGIIALSSVSSIASYRVYLTSYHFVRHQLLMGFLPGMILFCLGYKMHYSIWKKVSFFVFIFALLLMILVFVPGISTAHSTSRWISVFGFSFQPAEFLKLALIMYLATIFSKSDSEIDTVAGGLIPVALVLGVCAGLLILQPDLGTLIIVASIGLAIYFIAGAKVSHLAGLIFTGALLAWIAVQTAPYRLARLTAFLDPSKDPLGIGYHINQALIAVGSGGFLGVGLGLSRQKFAYLPEVFGDSIFAIIAEELGFVFSVILVAAFVYLVIRGFRVARNSPDEFAKLMALGISFWIVFQAVINIMSMIGLMPMTGAPLPFISYGGSAMMLNLFAMGILLNISKYSKA